MRVAAAQLPGVADSDDRTFTTDNAVIMLDGASAFVPVPVPAATYADHLGRSIRDQLAHDPDASLPGILAEAIARTARQLNLTAGQSPSSTVAIARTTGEHVDLLVLGDTQIVTPAEIIRDDRQDLIATEPRAKYRQRLATGGGYDDEHRALLRELQTEQAHHRNRHGGYWIAETNPDAAHHALTKRLQINQAPWLVLATDGAYTIAEHLGLDNWPRIANATTSTLATLLRQCHQWESETDPTGSELPRAKRHDDKSLAAITFNSGQ